VRMFNNQKRIDFSYSINKKSVIDPEAIYIAFPFKVEHFEIHSDVPGGTFKAGEEQIPGSSNDWNTVQNFVAIRNGDHQVVLGSHQAPLMQFGNINTGRYEADAKPENPHIYGWPMNNYWVTNFNANQYGEYRWTYYFTSSKETDNGTATRFGWESRIPFLNRVMPAGVEGKDKTDRRSVISDFPSNVLLVNARPAKDDNGIFLQVRETEGKRVSFIPASAVVSSFMVEETNVNGEINGSGSQAEIDLQPYETKFLKLSWE
jgi:alpha-mannosidase